MVGAVRLSVGTLLEAAVHAFAFDFGRTEPACGQRLSDRPREPDVVIRPHEVKPRGPALFFLALGRPDVLGTNQAQLAPDARERRPTCGSTPRPRLLRRPPASPDARARAARAARRFLRAERRRVRSSRARARACSIVSGNGTDHPGLSAHEEAGIRLPASAQGRGNCPAAPDRGETRRRSCGRAFKPQESGVFRPFREAVAPDLAVQRPQADSRAWRRCASCRSRCAGASRRSARARPLRPSCRRRARRSAPPRLGAQRQRQVRHLERPAAGREHHHALDGVLAARARCPATRVPPGARARRR